MTKRIALLRADGSASIGTGHVMRCRTLAGRLLTSGWDTVMAVRELPPDLASAVRRAGTTLLEIPADVSIGSEPEFISDHLSSLVGLCVTDHYRISASWHRAARRWASLIMAIDDLAESTQDVDLLLNQNLGATRARYRALVPDGASLLLGPGYALLRPQFAEVRATLPPREGSIARLLVFLGGADAPDVTRRAVLAASRFPLTVDVVIGPAYEHRAALESLAAEQPDITIHSDVEDMATLMARADLAIGAPGSASWERCALALPALLVTLADNQVEVAGLLHQAGAAESLGWHHEVSSAGIERAIRCLMDAPERMRAISQAARAIADGSGTDRVVDEIERLISTRATTWR